MKNELRVLILKKGEGKRARSVYDPKKLHSNLNSLMNFILFDFIMLFDSFILFQITYLSVAKKSEIFA